MAVHDSAISPITNYGIIGLCTTQGLRMLDIRSLFPFENEAITPVLGINHPAPASRLLDESFVL